MTTGGMMLNSALLALGLAVAGQGPSLDSVRVLTPVVKQYERAEAALPFSPGKANPFDPNSVALDGTVTLPSGKTLRVPGFWFQDYRRSLKDPAARPKER